ncbi:MAG: alanine dehydrogenase [Melioribacteraceae bacterium]|jgi:alanine dehydrogenase|nr:alanine dehydrogenase [Melioribacteraceae bacterium]
MRIGIPKETHHEEKRVAIVPAGVDTLTKQGHTVFIETEAGDGSHFNDEEYRKAGATVVYSREEVYQRAEVIAQISPMTEEEVSLLEEKQIVLAFHKFAVGDKKVLEEMLDRKITAISYELIEKNDEAPILHSMSEIAGQLAVQIGERYLGSDYEFGRGILMGGITGVAPAAVVILGAGVVGLNAARAVIGRGAQVIVLDKDVRRLKRIENTLSKNITTVVANPYTIARGVKFADLLICGVQVKGEKVPHLINTEMIKTMKKGSVIVDLSIDHGGCVETSRPTTISDPVFVKHDVIHYCVPNIPALAARTASFGLSNSALDYIVEISNNGLSNAVLGDTDFSKGICTYNGYCTNQVIADTFNLEYRRLHIFSTN